MHLKSIHLNNFRGFTDLRLADIPREAKIVMLIGPNGTGKSSIFDAFLIWTGTKGPGVNWDDTFHVKKSWAQTHNWPQAISSFELHEGEPTDSAAWYKLCYFRSAYRNEVEFRGSPGDVPNISERRLHRTIENDAAVSTNYRRLILQTIRDVWDIGRPNRTMSLEQYANQIVQKVNDSLGRVLPHLKMESLGDPGANDGNFYFTKGISKGYLFKNLSGGEKAVFDMLIDMIVKMPYFDDSLICVDEPESHINPAVHGALLAELVKLTPERSQLWIASHAIGMLRQARDIEARDPGTVAFINFEANFDEPVVLRPSKMDRATWQRALAVALDDLSALVSPKRIVVCEGGNGQFADDALDAQVYNRVFGESEPDTQFFSAGSHHDTQRARGILVALRGSALPGLDVKRLIDRDDRSDAEVALERSQGTLVLSGRNLESYLFGDEVIRALCVSVGKSELAEELIKYRDDAIANRNGRVDDFKAVAGETYVFCKKRLGLTGAGNNTKAFMRDTLAPLVIAGTATFNELRRDIFGN